MPQNRGLKRKLWKQERAKENKFFASIYEEIFMNAQSARTARSNDKSLWRLVLDGMQSHPAWVNHDARFRAPRPN